LAALENSGIHQGEFEQLFLAMGPEAPGEDIDYLHWERFENPYSKEYLGESLVS
jgi:hypothetical protein